MIPLSVRMLLVSRSIYFDTLKTRLCHLSSPCYSRHIEKVNELGRIVSGILASAALVHMPRPD